MSQETTSQSPTSAGELLKQGRLRQRLSIGECAKRTHISSRFLEALEDNRWDDLPSESHRVGFLRSYARFLGVPAEDVITLYERGRASGATGAPESASRAERKNAKEPGRPFLYPASGQQVLILLALGLLAAWVLYHTVGKKWLGEQRPYVLMHSRPRAPRLVAPRPALGNQKVRITSVASSWMRVTADNHLLFEGILPAGTQKEWISPAIFRMTFGTPHAVNVFWNDQPVDLSGMRDGSELTVPLARQSSSGR